jgi:integrase
MFLKLFLLRKKMSRGGWDVHRFIINLLTHWCTQPRLLTLADLTKEQGQGFLAYLATYVSPAAKRLVSPKTFGNWLTEQGWIKRKYRSFQSMKKRRVGKRERHTPYSQVQLIAILDFARVDPQLYLFLRFLYYTFARPYKAVRLLRVWDLRGSAMWISQAYDKNDWGLFCAIPSHSLARTDRQS